MAAKDRAIYFSHLLPLMGDRDSIMPTTFRRVKERLPLGIDCPLLRLTTSEVVYEVWGEKKMHFQVPDLLDDGTVVLRDVEWEMKPGDALRPFWRWANTAEKRWFYSRRNPFLPDDFAYFDGMLHVRLMMHFDDLLSLIRQLLYHIPVSYLGERLEVRGELLTTSRSDEAIRRTLSLLKEAEKALRQKGIPKNESVAITQESLQEALTGMRDQRGTPSLLAAEHINQAMEGSSAKAVMRSIIEAESALTDELVRRGMIIMATLANATAVVEMYWKTQHDGVEQAFKSLIKLIKDVEAVTTAPVARELANLARRADNLWARFVRVAPFNPYRKILFGDRGRGLLRARRHLQEGDARSAATNLKQTAGALRKFITGEAPRPGDITKTKRRAKRIFPEAVALSD